MARRTGTREWISLTIAAALVLPGAVATLAAPPPSPVNIVVDTLHGVAVGDPYRWLEDSEAEDVTAWTEAQWTYLREYVDGYPDTDRLRSRIASLMHIGGIGAPKVCDSLYIFHKRDSSQNHYVLYMQRGHRGEPTVLLDPNTFSEDGTAALDWTFLTEDGSLIAYGISQSGSELSTLHIMRTADRSMLPDTIPHTRWTSLAWLPDNTGFYYTRYPEPGTVPAGDENYYRWVYFHKLGDDWRTDRLVWGEGLPKDASTSVQITRDGRRLFFAAWKGWDDVDYYYADRSTGSDTPTPLFTEFKAVLNLIPLDDRLLIFTNLDAPRYRLFSTTYDKVEREHWVEIIPEKESILEDVNVIGGRLVVEYLKNAHSVVEMYTLDGELMKELAMPSLGTVSSVSGEEDGAELFYYFSSFNVPGAVYRYDFAADTTTVWAQIDAGVDVSDLVVKQVWYNSKDGTPVSMFIVHKEGLALDGSNPTYLYGYGGFNVNMVPGFSRTMTIWYDQGGVYALPNIRGGGEYGEEWHDAGKFEKRQNSFDDFIAAAEYLIAEKYTRPDKLCMSGGSNGGLLTGAVLVQRPDLFGAAIVAVPLLDMLRYHQFLVARLWIPEYGSSEDPEQFKYLYAYSPYHTVRDSVNYPATLLTAGVSDGRVHPLHARKMAARLQAADTSTDSPVLLRIEPKAGHGQGKPLSKQIDEVVDEWAFVFRALGMRMR